MHRGDIRVRRLMPRDCINATFALCFAHLEVTSGFDDRCRERLYKFNVCMMCYTHRGDIRVPWSMPRGCINSTFVLWFTRIEATSGPALTPITIGFPHAFVMLLGLLFSLRSPGDDLTHTYTYTYTYAYPSEHIHPCTHILTYTHTCTYSHGHWTPQLEDSRWWWNIHIHIYIHMPHICIYLHIHIHAPTPTGIGSQPQKWYIGGLQHLRNWMRGKRGMPLYSGYNNIEINSCVE